ncbi:hypothetical protein [Solirubrobacter soli]|uniref:hypothetical protein n=1 Tax=Solirubrobacter soli TaxID=363832 RepID=UPI0004241C78|nr:hypothetical protein [Solirubrobacter soli]
MSRRPITVAAAVVCLVAAAFFVPFLLRDHDLVASTPSPRPLFNVTPLALPANQPLCISRVTIPPDARQVRFTAITGGAPGPELAVTLAAPGYSARATVPAGYADATTVAPRITPPPDARLGTVCIARRGNTPVSLTATAETRTQSRPEGRIDGAPVDADAYLAFYEGATGTPLAHLGDIVDRASAFRPGIVGPWLLWPLLALAVLGVPAGVVWALRRAAA